MVFFKGGKASAANEPWDDLLQTKAELVELLDENSDAETTSCYGELDVVRVDCEIKNIDEKMNELKHRGKFVWSCILPVDTTWTNNNLQLSTKQRASYRVVAHYSKTRKSFSYEHLILNHEDKPIIPTKKMWFIRSLQVDVHEMVKILPSFLAWKKMIVTQQIE